MFLCLNNGNCEHIVSACRKKKKKKKKSILTFENRNDV